MEEFVFEGRTPFGACHQHDGAITDEGDAVGPPTHEFPHSAPVPDEEDVHDAAVVGRPEDPQIAAPGRVHPGHQRVSMPIGPSSGLEVKGPARPLDPMPRKTGPGGERTGAPTRAMGTPHGPRDEQHRSPARTPPRSGSSRAR
ncbi:MAG: hypothetical protein D6705_16135 [Deltaproteobacteria bacterium]|nr:MAG: hypothetical protein D6705_16135 [Deltaproteobacteria bacterium]